VVTHDLESASFVGQKLVLLKDGELHFEGTPEEFNTSDDEFVASFRTGGKVAR
jgi:phospholipid/cholesterol/gamma-HCH transport system ATP-binding protein